MLSGGGRGGPDHRHSLMDCQYINQPKLAGDYSEVRRAGRDQALGANKPVVRSALWSSSAAHDRSREQ